MTKNSDKEWKEGCKKAIAGLFSFLILLSLLAGGIGLAQGSDGSRNIVPEHAQTDEYMSFFEQNGATRIYAPENPVDVSYSSYGENSVISYEIRGFNAEKLILGEEVIFRLELEDEGVSLEKGYPDLPMIARSVIIPDDMLMDIRVTSTNYVEYSSVIVAPSKGNLMRREHPDPSLVPYEFGEVYEIDAWYPDEIVNLREPHIIRDFRGQVVEIYPFQYNPVRSTLRYYSEITVELYPVGYGGENVLTRTRPLSSVQRDFAQVYQSHFINYGCTINTLNNYIEEDGNMLIITSPTFANWMTPFVNWKISSGIPTEIRTTSQTGTSATAIKAFILNYYNTNDLTYVLLVGNQNHVATPIINGHASDPYYSFLVGSDYYPDIIVGRFSASTAAHVQTQVARSIFYEHTSGDWRTKATGIASDDEYMGWVDWVHMRNIRNRLYESELREYTWVDEFYDGSQGEDDAPGDPTPAMISAALNEGRHLVNYCGHGMSTELVTGDFTRNHIHALTNTQKLPFFIIVACQVGNFIAVNECFAEAWLRATNNQGEATGGIAAFASSTYQTWVPPMRAQSAMMDAYLGRFPFGNSPRITTGGIAITGCIRMIEIGPPATVKDELLAWHLFGDPSLVITRDHDPVPLVPHVNINYPSQGQTVWGPSVTPTWSSNTPLEGISHFSIRRRFGSGPWSGWINKGKSTYHTYTDMFTGQWTVQVRITTIHSQTSTQSRTFNVISGWGPLSIDTVDVRGDTVTLGWSLDIDEKTEANYYEVRLNDGEWLNVGTRTRHIFRGLEAGRYVVTVRTVDIKGEVFQDYAEFVVSKG